MDGRDGRHNLAAGITGIMAIDSSKVCLHTVGYDRRISVFKAEMLPDRRSPKDKAMAEPGRASRSLTALGIAGVPARMGTLDPVMGITAYRFRSERKR
jgi:hypothetical protein